jgi:hypothetical protein
MSKKTRKQLASLPFSEKLKLLGKLRDRSLAIAGSGARARKADRSFAKTASATTRKRPLTRGKPPRRS